MTIDITLFNYRDKIIKYIQQDYFDDSIYYVPSDKVARVNHIIALSCQDWKDMKPLVRKQLTKMFPSKESVFVEETNKITTFLSQIILMTPFR